MQSDKDKLLEFCEDAKIEVAAGYGCDYAVPYDQLVEFINQLKLSK